LSTNSEKGKKKRLKKRSPESKKIKKSKAWQKKKELALKNVVQLPVQKENHANKDSNLINIYLYWQFIKVLFLF